MSKIYKTQTKEHTTTHDQSKIRIYTCATNDKPPLDLKDEFFALESHLHYLCHQLVPGNTSFNYHQTPPLSRKQTTIKDIIHRYNINLHFLFKLSIRSIPKPTTLPIP